MHHVLQHGVKLGGKSTPISYIYTAIYFEYLYGIMLYNTYMYDFSFFDVFFLLDIFMKVLLSWGKRAQSK